MTKSEEATLHKFVKDLPAIWAIKENLMVMLGVKETFELILESKVVKADYVEFIKAEVLNVKEKIAIAEAELDEEINRQKSAFGIESASADVKDFTKRDVLLDWMDKK